MPEKPEKPATKDEETTWAEQPTEDTEDTEEKKETSPKKPSKAEVPLFKLLREIKEAIVSKEQQRAHHLDKIATATDRIATALEALAKLPTKTSVTAVPTPPAKPATLPVKTKEEKTVPTPTPTPTPAMPSVLEKVKNFFPKDLSDLLKFEDLGDYIKVAPRQYLGSENFAKIAAIVRDNGGEYRSAGKDSHFRMNK